VRGSHMRRLSVSNFLSPLRSPRLGVEDEPAASTGGPSHKALVLTEPSMLYGVGHARAQR